MIKKLSIIANKNNLGQELAEFAITLPLLMLILIGVFDLGRVVYYASALQNAAREGARLGIVTPWDTNAVVNRVKSRSLAVDPNDITVNVTWNCPTVEVDIDFDYRPMTPLIGRFFSGGEATISLSSALQRERFLLSGADAGCNPGA